MSLPLSTGLESHEHLPKYIVIEKIQVKSENWLWEGNDRS